MTKNNNLWLRANENSELLDAVQNSNLENVAQMSILRKKWSVEEITLASEIVDARKRAIGKLENADSILSDSVGVQQATSTRIAKHKAKRFTTGGPVFDFCCGIGSDLRELPAQTIGIDHDPVRCFMAQHNTGKETNCEDVLSMKLPSNALVHIDPSRRTADKRLHSLDAMQPSIEEIATIASRCEGGCIKVSPSTDLEDLEHFPIPFELEYIEENGRVVQGVIWFGVLAHNAGQVTATSMMLNQSVSGLPVAPPFGNNIHGWILEPNPALERAGLHGNLAGKLGASELASGIGLLTSPVMPDSPWCKAFKVLETTSLRIEKVAQVLANFGCTQVEVKTRDKVVDPNQWQNELTSNNSGALLTIFAIRLGKKRVAVIAHRHEQP